MTTTPATHTPQSIAKLYAKGGSLPDAEIARLATYDRDAWTAAIDPAYRARILKATPDEVMTRARFDEYVAKQLAPTIVTAINKMFALHLPKVVAPFEPMQNWIKALETEVRESAEKALAMETALAMALERSKIIEREVRELRVEPTGPIAGIEEIKELLRAPVVGKRNEAGELVAQRVLPPKTPTTEEKISELEHQVKSLEERPIPEYKGVWDKDVHYPIASMVTHNGSVWHAQIGSKGVKPGDANNMWKLAVKGTR